LGGKELIYFILKGLIITLILAFLFVLLKNSYLEFLLNYIKKIRGTQNYEGENKAEEFYIILTRIITPTIMIIVYVILWKIRKKS
jgi:hypothetical protein